MKSVLITLESLTPLQRKQLEAIELLDSQRSLVGDVFGALHTLTALPVSDIQGYALLVDEVPQGIFVLKRRTLLPTWAEGRTATLHALMIDRRFQGAGLGRYCLQQLPELATGLWPELEQLMLAVDPCNHVAQAMYKALGWQDAGNAHRTSTGFERRMVLSLTASSELARSMCKRGI